MYVIAVRSLATIPAEGSSAKRLMPPYVARKLLKSKTRALNYGDARGYELFHGPKKST